MGRAIINRSIIVKEWLLGREYSQISLSTHHTPAAVQNYVDKFKRVVALGEKGFDVHTISFLVKISSSLVEEYVQLYKTSEIVPHRKEELTTFLKKREFPSS